MTSLEARACERVGLRSRSPQWVLAQTLSPWFWVLVAAAAVNFAYNIWLVVKYRSAFRQETPTEARSHAE